MRTYESHDLLLPPGAIANPAFPHDERLDAARRFLASRGITEVRPVYGRRALTRFRVGSKVRVEAIRAANDGGDARVAVRGHRTAA